LGILVTFSSVSWLPLQSNLDSDWLFISNWWGIWLIGAVKIVYFAIKQPPVPSTLIRYLIRWNLRPLSFLPVGRLNRIQLARCHSNRYKFDNSQDFPLWILI